ncbi:MAG: glycosyltransferase [Nanoarchaeota archaeon]|nr:glycosyltransferase [Nanoarchaeota archaeon]MBU1005577.1 glycosyltransferase [Nanoarchaeota archaeon]MBU1945963.1 glycosyltransferase [Nanoarchaeota archaeon]
MDRKKVVVVGPIYPFRGGIAHSNTMLCSNLSKNHDVTSISFKRLYPKILFPGKAQKYEEKRKFDIKVEHIIDSINPFNWLSVFFRIRKINPDIVILLWWTIFLAPFSFTLLLLLNLFSNIKICILCHNVLQHEKRFFDNFLTKLIFKRADYFVVLASIDLKNLKHMVPNAKVKVFVEPTYDNFFSEAGISKEEAKKRIGLNGRVILFFGFVRPYKGLMYLIDAMPFVLKKINLTLLIAGEFWGDKDKYLHQIEKNNLSGNIRIVDKYLPDEEVPLYISCADVLVLPYTSATQSAILQTSFGFNKPVITTNVGGLPDFVRNNETGILIPPKDSKKLADAIIDFYITKKEKKFVNNIKSKRNLFAWNESREKILFHGL